MSEDLHAMIAALETWIHGVWSNDADLAQSVWVEDGLYLRDGIPTMPNAYSPACGLCNRFGRPVFEILSYSRFGPDIARIEVTQTGLEGSVSPCRLMPAVVVLRRERTATQAPKPWQICLVAPLEDKQDGSARHQVADETPQLRNRRSRCSMSSRVTMSPRMM